MLLVKHSQNSQEQINPVNMTALKNSADFFLKNINR